MMNRVGIVAGVAAAALWAFPGGIGAGQSDRDKALASLVEAERAFSRTSEERGVREAFLSFLDEKAVVFRPRPAEGRAVYERMAPGNPSFLSWAPEFAEVAASGELGYTTGPYVNGPSREVEPTRFGHYVSVWKKTLDGSWRVLLDIGVEHERPKSPPGAGVATPRARGAFAPLPPEALREAERAFSERVGAFEKAAATRGSRRALSEFAAADVRIYRPGKPPTVGKSAIKELVGANEGRAKPGAGSRSSEYQLGLSWSGDLAYTYGTFVFSKEGATAETTAYLRIWRKEPSGAWRICLDIELPVPAEAGQSASLS